MMEGEVIPVMGGQALSAQGFVEQWRLNHPLGPWTTPLLAQMMVEYAEAFIAKARAEERDQVTSVAAEMINEMFDALLTKVEAVPVIDRDKSDEALVRRADVLALFGGSSK